MTSFSLPHPTDSHSFSDTVDNLLSELRETVDHSTHATQSLIGYHLHYLLHQIDYPHSPYLETLVNSISFRLHNCNHLEQVRRASALYVLLQLVKNPRELPIYSSQLQVITTRPPLESFTVTPPSPPNIDNSLPDLEPISPSPSPTPTAIDPSPEESHTEIDSEPCTIILTPYSDDATVEIRDFNGPRPEQIARILRNSLLTTYLSRNIPNIRHFFSDPPTIPPSLLAPTNTPTEDDSTPAHAL